MMDHKDIDLDNLTRTFTLCTSEGFVENVGPALIRRMSTDAPGARLRFVAKPDRQSSPALDGTADLETGIGGRAIGPAVRTQQLFEDRFVGVVRRGHPLAKGEITSARYAGGRHVMVAGGGAELSPLDEALAAAGLNREIAIIVSGFSAALALVAQSDFIVAVPERHTQGLRAGMYSFPLPVAVPGIMVSLFWDERFDCDPAHRWLRGCLQDVCSSLTSEA